MNYFILGIGLIILVKGADLLVGSASKIAKIFKVPSFIVGLFIIAIGTSAPEAAVGIFSGIQGTNLIAVGDVVGSCIINITLIIGLTAIIFPLKVESSIPRREMLILIFIQICLIIMIFTSYALSRFESGLLLSGMILFSGYVYVKSKRGSKQGVSTTKFESEVFDYADMQDEVLYKDSLVENSDDEVLYEDSPIENSEDEVLYKASPMENSDKEVLYKDSSVENSDDKITDLNLGQTGKVTKNKSIPKLLFFLVLGLVGLIAGANMGVSSAVKIAHSFGLSEMLIGLTVIAFGTSLPELITSLVAVYKKEEDIAIGNIVGSNIINILFVLGISGFLHPITVSSGIFFDLFAMLGASILLFVPAFFFGKISRLTGFIYIIAYVIYLSVKVSSLG